MKIGRKVRPDVCNIGALCRFLFSTVAARSVIMITQELVSYGVLLNSFFLQTLGDKSIVQNPTLAAASGLAVWDYIRHRLPKMERE